MPSWLRSMALTKGSLVHMVTLAIAIAKKLLHSGLGLMLAKYSCFNCVIDSRIILIFCNSDPLEYSHNRSKV